MLQLFLPFPPGGIEEKGRSLFSPPAGVLTPFLPVEGEVVGGFLLFLSLLP